MSQATNSHARVAISIVLAGSLVVVAAFARHLGDPGSPAIAAIGISPLEDASCVGPLRLRLIGRTRDFASRFCRLRLENPTDERILVGAQSEMWPIVITEQPGRSRVDWAFSWGGTEHRVLAEVPARSAWTFTTDLRGSPAGCRFAVHTTDALGLGGEWISTDLLPHPNVRSIERNDAVRVRQVGWTGPGTHRRGRFQLENGTDQSIPYIAWLTASPASGTKRRDGTDEWQSACGYEFQDASLPAVSAVEFEQWVDSRTRVGVRVGQDVIWSDPVDVPDAFPPIEAEDGHATVPSLRIVQSGVLDHPYVVVRVMNPRSSPLHLTRSPDQWPNRWVELWTGAAFEDRASVTPRENSDTRSAADPNQVRNSSIDVPPRHCVEFQVDLLAPCLPFRVGVEVRDVDGSTSRLWSPRLDAPVEERE